MIEPAQRGLAQLLPAGRRHHSVEGVKEGLDDDAELEQTRVKGPIRAERTASPPNKGVSVSSVGGRIRPRTSSSEACGS